MKLINLKIENIASIESADIDFGEGPLADTSVFLITGDTGAGKSTILDSICLALYNTTPRLNMASGTKSNFGDDNITARNTSNLLRHGTRQASAVLRFVGSDGVEYEAAWQVRRNKNNRLTPPEQTLSWGEVTVKNAEAVSRIVTEAVGLDFDQFCRTTMLAQGQFTRFLKSKDDEKSEILEKLTGTGIYSEIGKKIEEIKKEKEAEYTAQKNRTAGIVLLNKEEKDLLMERLGQAETDKKALDRETERMEACMKWMENSDRLQRETAGAERMLKACEVVINSDAFREEARLISDMDRTGDARNCLQRMKEAERKTGELEKEAGKMGQVYVELCRGRNGLRNWIDEKKSYLASVREKLESASADAPMFAGAQKIEALLGAAYDASLRVRKYSGAIGEIKNGMPALEKKCADAQEAVDRASLIVEQKEKEYERAETELKSLRPEDVNDEVKRLNSEKDGLNSLNGNILELKNCGKTLERVEKEIAALDTELKLRNGEIVKATETYGEINRRYEEARKAYDSVQLSLKEWTVSLRSHLKVGDTCPVCGQKIDSLVTDAECSERLKPLEEIVSSLEKELRDAASACNGIALVIDKLKKDMAAKEKERREASDVRKETEKGVLLMCRRMAVVSDEITEMDIRVVENVIGERSLRLKTRMGELMEIQKRINDGNKRLSEQNRELSALRKAVDEAVKVRDRARDERVSAVKELERLSSLVEADNMVMEKSLDEAGGMITLKGWKERWTADSKGLITYITSAAAEYAGWEKEADRTEKLIAQALPAYENIGKMLTSVSEKWPEWAERNVTDAVLVDKLQDRCMDFSNRVHALSVSLDSERRNAREASVELERFFGEESEIDRERLEFLLTVDNLKEIREAHDRKIADFKTASGVLSARRKEQEAHMAVRPETLDGDVTVDMLKTSLDGMHKRAEEIMAEMGRIDQQLKSDEKNALRFSAEKEKEEALRSVFAEWDTLNKMFGGGDGKIFRRIAQSFILNDLLHRANGYLMKLNKRYRLDCEPGTLTIRMMDMYQNDAQGPVDILSGGEGFLVSLSLALALSSLNRRNLSVDTLFIDEGFGTLSSEVLNTVMNMLEKLQSMNGKRVGIISHVEGLKERIAVQVRVKRIDQTRSTVEVVDSRI